MCVEPSCVRCSAFLPSSVVSGLFAPHPWIYSWWCSPLAFARFLVGLFCFFAHTSTPRRRALYEQQFGGHVGKLPPRLPVLVEVCYSSITSSSSVPTPEVAMTPVLLSQHDLTRAFFQALGEELPQLVGALQGHVHWTNSSARESVSSATTALSSSVCYKLEPPQV